MTKTPTTTARVEVEMSTGWMEANPELFTNSVLEFINDYPALVWDHSIKLKRKGFVTLIAERRTASELPNDGNVHFVTDPETAKKVAIRNALREQNQTYGNKLKSDVKLHWPDEIEAHPERYRPDPLTSSDEHIRDWLQMQWKAKDWGLMDCDRCPDRGKKYKSDHPCDRCGRLKSLIVEYRKGKL